MKPQSIFLLCCAAALPQLAMAGVANTNPQGLGIVHAVLAYCEQVDPSHTAQYQAEWNSLLVGATNQQVSSIEGSSGFKQGSDAITAELKGMSQKVVADNCAAGASQWTAPAKPDRDDPKQVIKHDLRPTRKE